MMLNMDDDCSDDEDLEERRSQWDPDNEDNDEETSTWQKEIALLRRHNAVDYDPVEEVSGQPGILNDPPVLSQILNSAEQGIVSSKHNALVLNRSIVSLLRNALHSLQRKLNKNRREQEEISYYIQFAGSDSTAEIGSLKFFKCGFPFLRLIRAPPPNVYIRQMKSLGHILPIDFILNASTWLKMESRSLRELVISIEKQTELEKLNAHFKGIVRRGSGKEELEETKRNLLLLKKESSYIDPSQVDWLRVSASLRSPANFSPEECEARWVYAAGSHLNRTPWTEEERGKLFEVARQCYFQNWEKIATILGTGRSSFQCCVQFQEKYFKETHPWDPSEDEKILTLVSKFSRGHYIPWRKIYSFFENRSPRQIRDRYSLRLKPSIKGRFTAEEDRKLMAAAEICKGNWRGILKHFPHRSNVALLRRYDVLLKDRAAFTGMEDRLLLEAVATHGKNWDAVAAALPGRLCREVKRRFRSLQQFSKEVMESISEDKIRSGNSAEDLPYLQNAKKEESVWAVLQLMWEPRNTELPAQIIHGISLKNMTVPMQQLLRMLEFGIRHLFGPILRIPRTPEELKILTHRACYLSWSLSVSDDFTAVANRIDNLPDIQYPNSVFSSLDGIVPLPMPPAIWPLWVPPNVLTLIGLRTLFLAKGHILAEASLGMPHTVTWRDKRIARENRLSPSEAKTRLRSRMLRIFFLASCLLKIKKASVVSVVRFEKLVKPKPLTKLKVKKHSRAMNMARWKKALNVDEPTASTSEAVNTPPSASTSSSSTVAETPVPRKRAKMIHVSPERGTTTQVSGTSVPNRRGRPRKKHLS